METSEPTPSPFLPGVEFDLVGGNSHLGDLRTPFAPTSEAAMLSLRTASNNTMRPDAAPLRSSPQARKPPRARMRVTEELRWDRTSVTTSADPVGFGVGEEERADGGGLGGHRRRARACHLVRRT